MIDFYITENEPTVKTVKVDKDKKDLLVDITEIFLLSYSIRYKVEYTDKEGRLKTFIPKILYIEKSGETFRLINFTIPAEKFNIIQYRTDKYGYEKDIYYLFPIEIIRE